MPGIARLSPAPLRRPWAYSPSTTTTATTVTASATATAAPTAFKTTPKKMAEKLPPRELKRGISGIGLLDKLTSSDNIREARVAFFVKKLLQTIEQLHSKNTAHLDLKPENIMVSESVEDQIKLLDFGASRKLEPGQETVASMSVPEFVSPEIVVKKPVTLAADMWSVGVLTYVLLSGISPFIGDSDSETLENVVAGHWIFHQDHFKSISEDAKDFISKLLLINPRKRLTVYQALNHPWLLLAVDSQNKGTILNTEFLKEFKYKHQWVDRRIFVKSSPDEEETEDIEPSGLDLYFSPNVSLEPSQPHSFVSATLSLPSHGRVMDDAASVTALQGNSSVHAMTSSSEMEMAFSQSVITNNHQIMNGDGAASGELMNGAADSPLNPRSPAEPIEVNTGESAVSYPSSISSLSPSPSPVGNGTGNINNATYSEAPVAGAVRSLRNIEEELAARILSDISEEGSDTSEGAIMEDGEKTPVADDSPNQIPLLLQKAANGAASTRGRQSTKSSTFISADVDRPVTLSVEIPGSPNLSDFRRDHERQDSLSPIPPSYASSACSGSLLYSPMSPKEVHMKAVVRSRSPTSSQSMDFPEDGPLSTEPRHLVNGGPATSRAATLDDTDSLPRTPDPTVPYPKYETASENEFDRLMAEVDKAKKDFHVRMKELRNLNSKLESATEDAEKGPKLPDLDLSAYRSGAPTKLELFKQTLPPDPKYNSFPTREGSKSGTDIDFPRKTVALEELDWESEYQTGPETYLLQLRDSGLASRIRDYRRQLFPDDQTDYKEKSVLSTLNGSISVKERRRYTDVIREDDDIRHNMERLEKEGNENGTKFPPINRFRRVNLVPSVIQPALGAATGHGPIFHSRLREITFAADTTVRVSCTVLAQPEPEVQWYRYDEPVKTGPRISQSVQNGEAVLTFSPIYGTDAGLYKCLARNEHGSSWCSARVLEGDLPERPSRPDVELASDTEVFLTWLPPPTAGCTEEIQSYKVEYRKAGEGQWACPWGVISSSLMEEACVIRHLETQGIYQFRVVAKNVFGWGEPSLASRMIQTHPKGAHKLNIDLLKKEYHFSIINVPQMSSSSMTSSALGEIPEECEGSPEPECEDTFPEDMFGSPMGSKDLNTIDDPRSRYQLESEIFRGRFCIVRNAVDKSSEHAAHCAAKILLASEDCRAAALNEYEVLREVQHENIVSLFASFLRNDFLLLFMDKMHESLLQRFTLKDYYTEDNIARVTNQLLSALQWIHFKRIIHLDVQPDNVMFVGKRGWNVKLIDTGSSVRLSEQGETKPADTHIANPEFAAPELLHHGFVVPNSDIWGVGIIIYIMMSGYHPFSLCGDESPEEVTRNVTQTKLDLTYIHTSASDNALRFLTWSLKKHPSNRMTTEEGLQHAWLSMQNTALRRRENIKYSANKLRSFAINYMQKRVAQRTINTNLLSAYGSEPATTP